MKHVFVTGATGFVGEAIVERLLDQGDAHLHLLVRGAPDRVKAHDRITVHTGDISMDRLGLDESIWNELSAKVDTVFHSAASINFGMTLEDARKINVKGAESILNLASACHKNGVFKRLNYISTAYVAGKTKKTFYETQLDIGQSFGNSYEATKFEAEKLVNAHIANGLPAIIFRPSVISGDHKTGKINSGNITFELIRQLVAGNYPEFIASAGSSLNVITLDYLINAMFHITGDDVNVGKTFHITAEQNTNMRGVVETVAGLLDLDVPRFVDLDNQKDASVLTRMYLRPFVYYYEFSHTFNDDQAQEALLNTGIKRSPIDPEFLSRVVKYCKREEMI